MEDELIDNISDVTAGEEHIGTSLIGDQSDTVSCNVSFGSISNDEHLVPTFEELRNAGFSSTAAHNILDDSRIHCYTDHELSEVLKSDNPAEAYKEMMDEKAHDAIERADDIIDRIESDGLLGHDVMAKNTFATNCDIGDENAHHKNTMPNPSFLGNSITEARDRYASDLEDELSYKHIHITGSYGFDSDHGGFDRSTGQKIYDAIEKARGEERISDYTYKQLIDKLDDACYYQ